MVSLVFAVPQVITAQATLEATRNQSRNLEQQQLTERFSKAIEQLGTGDKLEIRLGGIYGLERIARDSPADQAAVVNVLATFVRENSQKRRDPTNYECRYYMTPTEDVAAALTVLIHRNPLPTDPRIDLEGACLPNTDLTGANLQNANLLQVGLHYADLTGARFDGANLKQVNLQNANLTGANFTGANLQYASLQNANFSSANFTGANLENAEGLSRP